MIDIIIALIIATGIKLVGDILGEDIKYIGFMIIYFLILILLKLK